MKVSIRWNWIAGALAAVLAGVAIMRFASAPRMVFAMPASQQSTVPPPVAVQLDPQTTALLILDVTSTICTPRPACVSTLPVDAALLKQARDTQTLVVYSMTPGAFSILPQVAPQGNEPVVAGRADKFYDTDLDDVLKSKGIKTVVIVGYVINGAVLYTSFGANLRAYSVVVPVDGTGSDDPFATALAFYQLLNEPGFSNPENKPLAEGRVTLSRSDLIRFGSGVVQANTGLSTIPIENLPPGPGRALLIPACDGCHSPLCGLLSKLTVDHWRTVRANHKTRVANLSDTDFNTLFDYIMSNFNDTQPEPNLPSEIKQRATCSAI